MRYLTSFSDEPTAARFGDFLHTKGVAATVEEDQSGSAFAIWVADDDHLDRARTELEQFQQSPDDPRYQQATKTAAALRKQEQKAQSRKRARVIDVRTHWHILSQPKFDLTIILILICGAVAAITLLGRNWNAVTWFLFSTRSDGTFVGGLGDILHGQVWRLLSPIFLHFGPLHLIFNLFWLRDLGTMIETRRGALFLAALVLASGIVGNVGQYAWTFEHPGAFGGMSGVVYGLFGYAWIMGRIAPHRNIGVDKTTTMIMLIWLVVCMTGIVGAIANAAHVAGLATGMATAYGPHLWRKLHR